MPLGLSRAGVRGIQKAIRISHGGSEKLIAAEIDCTVDLDPAQKGVHMSRFPELFEEAIEEVVIGEALLVESLAEHIARHIVERQSALRAEVQIVARYPLERETPVTGLRTQELVSLIGLAAASEARTRRLVGVEANGINACPCAQGLVRERAAERLGEAGFDELDVERILELVPLATHNQRGRGTLFVGTEAPINAEELVRIVEGSMSSPVYELLKRPDELFVVEHAHLQPRFVEDSVRIALRDTLEAYPELGADDFLLSRQVNLETIHTHDVVAERYGTAGELRAELDGGEAAGAPHRAARVAYGVAGASEAKARFGARAQAADVRPVQDEHRQRRQRREGDHRPGLLQQHRHDRQREGRGDRRDRGVAEEREGHEPDHEADPAHDRRDGEERAAAGRHRLAALGEAHEQRPPVAEHRRAAGDHPGQVADVDASPAARARIPSACRRASPARRSARRRCARRWWRRCSRCRPCGCPRAAAAARASSRSECSRPGSR